MLRTLTKDQVIAHLYANIDDTQRELKRARTMGMNRIIGLLEGKLIAYKEAIALLDGSVSRAKALKEAS